MGDVAGEVFHELPDSVESLSAFYCRWNLQADTICAPAVAQRLLSVAPVTMVSATALVTVRSRLEPFPLKLPGNAIRRVCVVVTPMLHASAATVPGKQK